MPICKKCQNRFPNQIYVDGKRKKIDTRVYCLECSPYKAGNRRDLTKEFKNSYHTSKEYMLAYYHKRQSRKLDLVLLKGGKCQQCGYDKCLDALVFHHRDSSSKTFGLSREYIWKVSWDKLVTEAEKCDLLCCNCHAEVHCNDKRPVTQLCEQREKAEFNGEDQVKTWLQSHS